MNTCLFDSGRNGIADDRFRFAQRAERDIDPEHVAEHSDHLAPTHMAVGNQHGREREHAGSERALRHTAGQRRARGFATDLAGRAVQPMLGDRRPDLWDVRDLMAYRVAIELLRQTTCTPAAVCWMVIGDRVDLLGWQELALASFVTRLPARLPAARRIARSRARSFGASLDGGLLEFEEFSPNRRRSSAFSALSAAISGACSSIFASSISTRVDGSLIPSCSDGRVE